MKKTTLRSLAFGLAAMLAIVSRAQTIERNMEELFSMVEKNVMLADTLIDKTRNRYEEGVVLRNDITRYELMREQMALQKVVIADRIKIVDKQMHTALYGEAPETPTGIEKHSDIDASILSLPMHDEAYWQDMALTENSNLKKATTSVELSKVQEKMARAASLPKVAITAAVHSVLCQRRNVCHSHTSIGFQPWDGCFSSCASPTYSTTATGCNGIIRAPSPCSQALTACCWHSSC